MKKRMLFSVAMTVLALLLFTAGSAFTGIAPSFFKTEINKLHSIELNLVAIRKNLEKLQSRGPLPKGTPNYLEATVNHLGVLDTRLADVINALQDPDIPYPGLDEVILSLHGIRTDASSIMNLFQNIYIRLGIAPSPFREVLDSIIFQATGYINAACSQGPAGTVCPQQ